MIDSTPNSPRPRPALTVDEPSTIATAVARHVDGEGEDDDRDEVERDGGEMVHGGAPALSGVLIERPELMENLWTGHGRSGNPIQRCIEGSDAASAGLSNVLPLVVASPATQATTTGNDLCPGRTAS